jgi:reactive intermediate/imine deaminase
LSQSFEQGQKADDGGLCMKRMGLMCAALTALLWAVERRVISPPGSTVVGPYSPGILAGDFLYVSGQGARNREGKFASTIEQQVTDCLENVRAIVEAAGLSMEHVVYAQLYLDNAANYEKMNQAWRKAFPKDPPARATIGVYKMPTDTPVEISAVAVRDLKLKKVVIPPGYPSDAPISPGVLAAGRLFLSGTLGRDIQTGRIPEDPTDQVQLALDRIKQTLNAAGMDFRHVVFMNPYLTEKIPMDVMNRVYAKHFEFGNTPARATIRVASLPHDANIEFTGVAIQDLSKRKAVRPRNMEPSATASPCVWADDTLYCSAKAGFIPGPNSGIYAATIEHQVRQTMRNLLDGLEEAGLTFDHVVATNVYLDDLQEFSKMNAVYAEYFPKIKPTRTTVQPLPPLADRKPDAKGRYPKLEEISLIAVR